MVFAATDSKCVLISDRSCLGIELKYKWTSKAPFTEINNETDAKSKLATWKGLQIAPSCWQTIAPFLCSTYIPKCLNQTTILPCRSVCVKVRSVCGIVPSFYNGKWPSILNCNYYPSDGCMKVCTLQIL